MRTMTCECGHRLVGHDDEELVRQGRDHIQMIHPDMKLSDEELRTMIAANARDE